MCDELSQKQFARVLGVNRSHICDIEKGGKLVSPERVSAWSNILGYPDTVLVTLALQKQLDKAGVRT